MLTADVLGLVESVAGVLERVKTTEAMPVVGAALAAGDVSGGHVDVLTKALRGLEPGLRPMLVERAERLVQVAGEATPAELDRAVDVEVRRIGG
jgi:hypothetical protein